MSSLEIKDYEKYLSECKKNFNKKSNKSESTKNISDYKILQTIGAGGFGTVVLARDTSERRYYAIKIIEREKAVKAKRQTLNEKRLLMGFDFPFVMRMEHFFKDNTYLFFVLPFINGGDLFTYVRSRKCLTEEQSVFFGAQVVLALEYMHFLNVIYRDLKPENILIDWKGYIRLTDFGLAKIVKKRTYTICGTPAYMAPEILTGGGYTDCVDWWSFGVLLFEMVSGRPPFFAKDQLETFDLIVEGKYTMDPKFSPQLQKLVEQLITDKTSTRLGCLKGGANDIKNHEWFKGVPWLDIIHKKVKPPIKPRVVGPGDARNFTKYGKFELIENSQELFSNELKDF